MASACLENILKISGISIMAHTNTFQAPQLVNIIDDDIDIFTPRVYNNGAERKPKPSVAEFSDDPVALSITSYLIWKSNPHRKWVPVDEVGQVTPEARSMAQELRTYFLHRNTMKILQGHQPTEFQNKMMGLLADTRQLKTDELGILYRLPYFWQEDLALDQVFEGAVNIDIKPAGPHLPVWHTVTTHARLTPICEVLKSRKSGDFVQFWFANSDGERCMYAVRADNSLISMFRSLFKRESMQVKATAMLHRMPGSHIRTSYWKLSGLELE
jgi:hypothetical protein